MAKKLQILASNAEDCRFWDDGFTSIGALSGTGTSYADVAWSPNSENFAGLAKGSSVIELAAFRGKTFQKTSSSVAKVELTTLCYISLNNKENLLLGTAAGEVLLWDQIWHKPLQKYSSNVCKASVVRVQTNGSAIASGHETGQILIYGISTGQLINHFSLTDSMALVDMKFSPLKKSLLAASFESGCVALWDALATENRNSLLFYKNSHQAPATGVALSPINELLMLSSGLDKKIILYDCPQKKILKEIVADAPVTTVEFLSETRCFAVGTTKGKIHVYDLKSPSAPARTFQAHTTSIKKLFASQPIIQDERITKLSTGKIPILSKNLTATKVQLLETPTENQRRRSRSQGPDISRRESSLFSPLKNFESSLPSNTTNLSFSTALKKSGPFSLDGTDSILSKTPGTPATFSSGENSAFSKLDIGSRPKSSFPEINVNPVLPDFLPPQVAGNEAAEATVEQKEKIIHSFDIEVIRGIIQENVQGIQADLSQGVFTILWQLLSKYHCLDAKVEKITELLQERLAMEEEIIRLREENRKLKTLY